MLNPQEMREKTKDKSSLFLSYKQNFKDYPENLHCFFEGEDNKYYSSRIEKYTEYTMNDICNYDCNGRDGVIKLFRKLKSSEFWDDSKYLFFVDRDYDIISYTEHKELYQTDMYSIENFYTHIDCFKKILNVEFSFNSVDYAFKNTLKDYLEIHREFQKITFPINVWNKIQKEKGIAIKLSCYEMTYFIQSIKLDKITLEKDINFDSLLDFHVTNIQNNKNILQDVKEKMIEQLKDTSAIEFLKQCNDYSFENAEKLSRGKYEIYFLEKILYDMLQKNKQTDYFRKEIVHLNVNATVSKIGSYSLYAHTPNCLVLYLSKFKKVKQIG